jgi:hypothetical protein
MLLAVNNHQLLCTKGTWNGVSTTGTDYVFVQNQSWSRVPPICWNCGGEQTLADCGRNRNSARIEEGKRRFMAAREENQARNGNNEGGPAANNGGGGDWKTQPPSPTHRKRWSTTENTGSSRRVAENGYSIIIIFLRVR